MLGSISDFDSLKRPQLTAWLSPAAWARGCFVFRASFSNEARDDVEDSPVRHLLASALIVLLFLSPDLVRADTVVIPSARDNTLIEDPAGAVSNGSGPSIFAGKIGLGTIRRAVLLFDVAAHIPPGAVVDTVELRLHVSSAGAAEEPMVTLHSLLVDWGEGASSASGGSGAASAPDDATWIHTFYPNQYWTSPGGDFDPVASASTLVGEFGFFVWADSGMTADVQLWLDGVKPNHGWLLRGDETRVSTVRRFDSRENPEGSVRPVLIVDYTPGATQVQPESWGRIKSQYRIGRHR
jgi:hypothetical protein